MLATDFLHFRKILQLFTTIECDMSENDNSSNNKNSASALFLIDN